MKPQPCTLTEQSLFDSTVLHLAAQGERSVASNGVKCLYRGPTGRKCAVGFHITDDEYRPSMEMAGSVFRLVRCDLLPNRLMPFEELLGALQCAHDRGKTPRMMAKELLVAASRFRLDDRSVRAAFAEHLP